NVPSYLPGIIQIGTVRLPRERLLAALVAVVLGAAPYWLGFRAQIGVPMRALEGDQGTGRVLGARPKPPAAAGGAAPARPAAGGGVALAFLLAGVAGAFVAPIYSLNPGMGLDVIVMSFLIIIVGGLGSITGTVLAGLLVGVIESIGAVLFGSQVAYGLVFLVMIAVLI